MKKPADLKVFISSRDSTCDECGEELGRKAWITLVEDKGALCLACADMDHLLFLPEGYDRWDARAQVEGSVNRVLSAWRAPT